MRRLFAIFMLTLIFLPSVLAITGEIGNARAIIDREWNGKETIERTILVINSNDVKLDITLEPSAGLEDIVELIDGEFELQPGEEKKARFNLKIEEEGRWNGKINVFFRPEEGNSVVLSSTIVLIVGDVEERDEIPEELPDDEDDNEITGDVVREEDDDADDSGVGFGIKGARDNNSNAGTVILIIVIALIVIGAVVGSYFLFKR